MRWKYGKDSDSGRWPVSPKKGGVTPVVGNVTTANSSNYVSCHLKLFEDDHAQYQKVMEGFVQGLYASPPAECTLCGTLGLAAGTL